MSPSLNTFCEHDTLDDESEVLVRAIHPDDRLLLSEAFSRLSGESILSRFFWKKQSLSCEELHYFTEVDFTSHVAIGIGLLEKGKTFPIGIGRYIVDADHPNSAEIALTVDEMYQGIGVASLMLKHLCAIARANNIEEFHATILSGNDKMIHVLDRSRLPLQIVSEEGALDVTIDITTTDSTAPSKCEPSDIQ
jgi:RimJ/RimL family protein N-acetyltransferase